MRYFFIFIYLIANLGFSQNQKIENLLKKFKSTVLSNSDSSYYYINSAIIESKIQKDSYSLSNCYYNLGYYYYYTKKDLEKDEKNTKLAFLFADKSKNNVIIASSLIHLGQIEMDRSNYNNSLKLLQKALDFSEKNKLPKNTSNSLQTLGNLFDLQKDTIKALFFFKANEKIILLNKLDQELLYNNVCIANLLRKSKKRESIDYYKKSYTIAENNKDIYLQFSIQINLAAVYVSISNKNSFSKALICLKSAEKLAVDSKDNTNLFYVYFNYGGYYNKSKNFNKAETYYLKANSLSNSGIDNEQLLNLYKALEKNYKAKGDFKNAYLYNESYQKLKDSIFTIEKSKIFNDIQTKYEVEKKNLKIDLLSKEKIIEQNKKRLILYIGLALLLPLTFLLLFYKNRIKLQKIIIQKENELFLQEKTKLQQEQELKRIIGLVEGQDQERNRIAKEIHDGVGGELAGIKLNLSQINLTVNNEKITMILSQISGLFQELRNISHNLSSNFIKNKDFTQVLFDLKNEYDDRNEFETEIIVFPKNAFEQTSENVKHQIYRIVQELLANIFKHAMAKHVSISITKHDSFMNIIIEDDGKGFEENVAHGIGLKNIAERIEGLNGKLLLETELSKGSTFIIDIPNQPI